MEPIGFVITQFINKEYLKGYYLWVKTKSGDKQVSSEKEMTFFTLNINTGILTIDTPYQQLANEETWRNNEVEKLVSKLRSIGFQNVRLINK